MWLWLTLASAMTLDSALSAAQERSPANALAEARISEAKARRTEARGHLLPTATLSGAAVLQNEVTFNIADQLPEIPILDPNDFEPLIVVPGFQLQAAAEVTQPIIAPQGWSAGGAARAGVALANAEKEATLADLRAAVVDAWHRSAEARALVTDAQAGVEQAERLVERAEAMVELGVATEDRILPFRRALASARANLETARAGSAAADGVLAQLTGMEGGADPVGGGQELPELDGMLTGIDRPDLDAARERVEAASAAKRVERTRLMPIVAAKAGVYAVDPAPTLGNPLNWRVQVGATLPLFQGGTVAARVSGASARVAQADAALRAQEERAAIEIRTAHAQLATSLASLSAREEAVEFADQGVAAAEARLDGGGGSLLELQQAQAEQIQARAELTMARSAASRARHQLDQATGN